MAGSIAPGSYSADVIIAMASGDIEDWGRHGACAHTFTDDEVVGVRRELLTWYHGHRRKLPWRGDGVPGGTVSPYGTWVSEVMLQQTRVEAVIEHYNRWMERFPTVQALADASIEVWSAVGPMSLRPPA